LSPRVSVALNTVGLIFLLFASITFNFPTVNPVNKDTMNYTSAAVGVIGLISVVTWFTTGKARFTGPADASSENASSGSDTKPIEHNSKAKGGT
jgi:choline transport protein